MADYIATIDDSGGIEPLVKWGGQYVAGDHPVTCITSLLLNTELLDEFNEMWVGLRCEIQGYLGCDHLPPIHMRLMYGRHLPPQYRGRQNPYIGCEFAKTLEWVSKGVQIIEHFRRKPHSLTWNTIFEKRKDLAERILEYFSDPDLVAELNFLAAHGRRGARRSFAQRYLKKMASPLLPLLTRQILELNEIMRQLKGKKVTLQLDPFADASGLDAEILDAINMVSNLSYIAGINVMNDTDDVQLAQAVDLIGFIVFRIAMARNGFIESDKALLKIMEEYSSNRKFVAADVRHIVGRRLAKNSEIGTSIHYAVARSVVEKMDSDFANRHMLEVVEFHERIKDFADRRKGHSILKDETG